MSNQSPLNPDDEVRLKSALEQSANGQVVSRGSFAQPTLNPDALKALHDAVEECGGSYWADVNREEYAEYLVSAYLAVAQPVVNTVEELDALPDGAIVECLTDELVSVDTLPIVVKQPGNWWHGGWDWECNISPKQLIPAKIIRLP